MSTMTDQTVSANAIRPFPPVNYSDAKMADCRRRITATRSFIADAANAGKMTIPIAQREELKNAGAAQAALTKGGIGKVLLVP